MTLQTATNKPSQRNAAPSVPIHTLHLVAPGEQVGNMNPLAYAAAQDSGPPPHAPAETTSSALADRHQAMLKEELLKKLSL